MKNCFQSAAAGKNASVFPSSHLLCVVYMTLFSCRSSIKKKNKKNVLVSIISMGGGDGGGQGTKKEKKNQRPPLRLKRKAAFSRTCCIFKQSCGSDWCTAQHFKWSLLLLLHVPQPAAPAGLCSQTSLLSITLSCRNERERFQYRGNETEDKKDKTEEIKIWDFQTLAKKRIFFFGSGLRMRVKTEAVRQAGRSGWAFCLCSFSHFFL